MSVYAVSDIHGRLPDPADLPVCDVLIVAGDICPDFLNSSYDKGEARQANWLHKEFRKWLEDCYAEGVSEIVGIAGNHDFVFERGIQPHDLPWTYLQDRVETICGLSMAGVPWCPNLARWAFYADDKRLKAKYEALPDGLDILISHSPPHGYGDLIPKNSRFNYSAHDINVGTHQLTNILYEKAPKVVISGHIHEGRGRYEYHSKGVVVYNVSYLTEQYKPYALPSFTEIEEFSNE